MATNMTTAFSDISQPEYRRRIRAWTMYDWANSAFVTSIMAAILPIYYSQEAGATLPSAATATAYWSTGLSISLLIVAIMSPILGTISDVMRGKKRFLAFFAGLGIVATGLLVLVETGDWLLASLLFVFGRIGFTAANVFYDALLPHVAREEDRDIVSTRGYAMGYLGGGILLAINVAMLIYLPGTWGARISFLSVAIWWGVFSIPIFLRVPEPHTATANLASDQNIIKVSFIRLRETFKDIRQYRELIKYLFAFLIYVDGIGTIIGVAAIYGTELGFGSVELVLALLLVQFVGIPYSLIFGRLPSPKEKRRPFYLAFILFNLVALPLVGVAGSRLLPSQTIGSPPPPYSSTDTSLGEGIYTAADDSIGYTGTWESVTVDAEKIGTRIDITYLTTVAADAHFDVPFNGQEIKIVFSTGPDHGIWAVKLDGSPLLDENNGTAITIDAYSPTIRYDVEQNFRAETPGEHSVSMINTGEKNPDSSGTRMTFSGGEVLPPTRQSNLLIIIGMILAVELVGLVLSFLLGPSLFSGIADTIDTKRAILLALLVYTVVAIWGFALDSVIEFWCLAWMVAVVQGGSQALSRSLFSVMSPASKSGEFFGLFGVMEKFSAIIGPLIFASAATIFGSSRPAVLSLIAFFFIGGFLLMRVNVDEGRRVAQAEDAAFLESVKTA